MIHKKLLSLLVLLMTTVSMSAYVPVYETQISVTVPTGNAITIDLMSNSTVAYIKEKIEAQTHIPIALQILTFDNHVLVDNNQTLSDLYPAFDPTFTLSLVSGNYYLNGGSTDNCPVSFKVGNSDGVVTAREDDVVTVTFTPTAPYVLTAVTANAYTTWAGARRAVPEPTPTIPMLGDITLTPVQGQANTYTFTMPSSHVMFNNTLRQSSGLAWTLGGNELADGATVNYCKGFPFTAPVLFNPNGLHYQFEVEGEDISLDDNTAVTVGEQAQPGTYTITASFDGDETYQATTVTYNLVISEPAILSVAADPTTGGTVEVVIPESGVIANQDGTYSVVPGTSVSLKATAANGYQLNSWSDNVMPDTDDNTVATITVSETATATATFGEKEYEVDLTVNGDDAQGTEKAKWTGKVGEQGTAANFPITAKTGQAVTISYNGRRKVKAVTATTDAEPVTLATPLTIEAVTPGTIVVNITDEDDNPVTLQSGMKYSKDGGTTKTLITQSADIPVAKGDKVQFYGNGTDTQVYGGDAAVKILGSGDGFQTKVYGNIMSLLYETGFATKTELPDAEYVFFGLFAGNTTLIDASELLLPAATLADYCYQGMFESCTNLTTAPKLPAETLADMCYEGMFNGCNRLTNAYVKAAYTEVAYSCSSMFDGCTADGAVLHTTPGYSKDSWEDVMGEGKTWPDWTVAADWED